MMKARVALLLRWICLGLLTGALASSCQQSGLLSKTWTRDPQWNSSAKGQNESTVASVPPTAQHAVRQREQADLEVLRKFASTMDFRYQKLLTPKNAFVASIEPSGKKVARDSIQTSQESLEIYGQGYLTSSSLFRLSYKDVSRGWVETFEYSCGLWGCKVVKNILKDRNRVLFLMQALILKIDQYLKKEMHKSPRAFGLLATMSSQSLSEGMVMVIASAVLIGTGLLILSLVYCVQTALRVGRVQNFIGRILNWLRPSREDVRTLQVQQRIQTIEAIVLYIVENPGDTNPSYVLGEPPHLPTRMSEGEPLGSQGSLVKALSELYDSQPTSASLR